MTEEREYQNEPQLMALKELRGMGYGLIEDGGAVIVISKLSTPNHLGRATKATRYESPVDALVMLRDKEPRQ